MNKYFVALVRSLGHLVCLIRGHKYFYPGGEVCSWVAYSCVRCGDLDRPLENLPYRPDDDYFDRTETVELQEYIDQQHELERRWVSCLRFPRWI